MCQNVGEAINNIIKTFAFKLSAIGSEFIDIAIPSRAKICLPRLSGTGHTGSGRPQPARSCAHALQKQPNNRTFLQRDVVVSDIKHP